MAQPSLISTPLDIRALVPALVNNAGEWVVPLGTLNQFIMLADGPIRSELREIYGSDLTCTPYAGVPYWVLDSLSGGAVLYAASASASAVSETWTLKFSSTSTYTFKGSMSGSSQGSGSTASTGTSTNSYISIASTNWDISTLPAVNDTYYISLYNYETTLVQLSSLFAAANLLDSVYGEEVPNTSSDSSERFRTEARRILNKLTDPDTQMELECGRVTINTAPWHLAGGLEEISDAGDWSTDFSDDEGFSR